MRQWWRVFLAASALACAGCLAIGPGPVTKAVTLAWAGLSVAALLAGVRLNRPAAPRPWWLLAAAIGAWGVGDVVYTVLESRGRAPFPSAADVVYLAGYPAAAAGLWSLIRQQHRHQHQHRHRHRHGGRDVAAGVDSALVTIGMGLLAWVFLASPVLEDPTEPLLARLTGAAYPFGDVLLLAMLVRLVVAPGARSGAFRLLIAGISAMLVADTGFAVLTLVADGTESTLLDAVWQGGYALIGAAALHPSSRAVADAPAEPVGHLTRRRLAVLTAAVLTAPAVLAVHLHRGRDGAGQMGVALAASVVMYLLVVLRMHLAAEAVARSTSQRDRLREDLAHQAAHDPLTELTNRARTLELVAAALRRSTEDHSDVAVMFVDLDHFKSVNDSHGHATGDLVLQHAARRMRALVRVGDVVGRMGGDEFVVLLRGAPQPTALLDLARRIAAELAVPVPVAGRPVTIGASVGVAVSAPGEHDAASLVHHADLAAYRAKSDGRGRAVMFDAALRTQLGEQERVEAALRTAIGEDQLVLHYQPVVSLDTGAVIAVEALVRWRRHDGTTVPPDAFVPIAERSDLVCDLDRWVLREATRQLASWAADHPEVLGATAVAVNVSGRHLARADVVDDVRAALRASGLAPHRLVLEVTETVLVDEPTWRRQLDLLRRLGVGVSIDDFGTGYTSIGQLQQLQADAVKIDRSFVQSPDPGTRDLVLLMIAAAHAFGLRVVAEGVEDQHQADALRDMGCDFAQGFHIARPAGADDLVRRLLGASLPDLSLHSPLPTGR